MLGAVFLDIEGAFDAVQGDILARDLWELSFPPNLIFLLVKYISNRKLNIILGNKSTTRVAKKGLPQGSVLSPILFNIYMFKIISEIPENCKILLYADDCVVYTAANSWDSVKSRLENAMKITAQNLKEEGLKLAENKTKLCCFTKKHLKGKIYIDIGNTKIQRSSDISFLGVTLDQKLTWKKTHIHD